MGRAMTTTCRAALLEAHPNVFSPVETFWFQFFLFGEVEKATFYREGYWAHRPEDATKTDQVWQPAP